jgi:hypothetical protein
MAKDYMINLSRAAIILTALCLAPLLHGQSTNLSFAPQPEWVRPADWTTSAPRVSQDKSQGTRYLLYERQDHPGRKESFMRVVLLMENETGVQDSGNLSFGFDPSYESLVLHRVTIHRNRQALDRLDKAKLKLIQPEPQWSEDVITGRQTALLFVEDLRVGDALEYAFTRRGQNPVIGDHYSSRMLVQSGQPLDRQRLRVIWSGPAPLHTRQHQITQQPATRNSGLTRDYLWDFTNLSAVVYEDNLPGGFEPFPYLEFSDFEDWARVVEWALPLYAIEATNLPPELRQLIAQWQGTAVGSEETARLALQFVQDDLRYTGLELGPDSYRPTPPAETFEKRFGDCKGKSLLLCAILRAMGMEAHPALVNTTARESLARRLPSPFAFNHVIVKLQLPSGPVWMDPTISHQGGSLRTRHLPPYGLALEVRAGVTDLQSIPAGTADEARQNVATSVHIKDYDAPAAFTVITTSRGAGADNMRRHLARTDRKQISQDYLNYYARYYPGIESLAPFTVADDRARNVLTLQERYQIRDLWKRDGTTKRWQADFVGESLLDMLTEPATRLRKMPLRLHHPQRREHEVTVHLPGRDWQIPNTSSEVRHDAFTFRYRREFAKSKLNLFYECETHQPEISPARVADYLKKLKEMEAALGDTLFRMDNQPGAVFARINWLMIVVALFGLGAATFFSARIWRTGAASSSLPPPYPDANSLNGLGGWLVLVGLGICLGPFTRVIPLAQNWEGFFAIDVWQNVATPQGADYHPLLGPLLIFEVLSNAFLFVLNLLAIALFFKKRRAFPKVYIGLLLGGSILVIADELLSLGIPLLGDTKGTFNAASLVRTFAVSLLWCAYMLKSRRVQATFVR